MPIEKVDGKEVNVTFEEASDRPVAPGFHVGILPSAVPWSEHGRIAPFDAKPSNHLSRH